MLVFPSSFLYYSKNGRQEMLWGKKNWKCALRCSPNSIFLRVDLVKMSSKKAGNVISGTLTWKIFWRSMLPDPLSNFSSRRAYILQIWFGDQPQSSSIFYYFPPSMKNKRQVRAQPHPSKNAEARNCNQSFNLMARKRANFIVGSKV